MKSWRRVLPCWSVGSSPAAVMLLDCSHLPAFLFQVCCCLYPPTVCLCDVVFMDFLSMPDSVFICGSSHPFERPFCLFLEKPHSEISVHVTLALLVVVATGLVAKDELAVLSHCGRSSVPVTDVIRLWHKCTGRAGKTGRLPVSIHKFHRQRRREW